MGNKKLLFISILVLSLMGCAALQEQKANFDACLANPVCKASAEQYKATGELIGSAVGSVVPGAALPAQKAAGYLLMVVGALIGGSQIRKKK